MYSIQELIPTAEQIKNRTMREPPQKPTPESQEKMRQVLASFGYRNDNPEVYNAIVGFGAIVMDGTAKKGMILSGGVGIGKTMGVQILANHFRLPVFTPKMYASMYKEFNGNGEEWERAVISAGNISETPMHIVIDELGQKDTTKHFGEVTEVMLEVMEIRHRAFLNHGVHTLITTNLDDAGLKERYGVQINDRLNEMCYFKAVNGKSLR